MDATTNISCPVCTLYLRPGITLKTHLSSHPKQKVIEALVRLSQTPDLIITQSPDESCSSSTSTSSSSTSITPWHQGGAAGGGLVMPPLGNHVFIYQQSMSTTAPPNVLNMNPPPQYVIPTILNSQMMPYIYQQQVIMSGPCLNNQIRSLEMAEPVESSSKLEEIEDGEEKFEQSDDVSKDCETQTQMSPEAEYFSEPAPFDPNQLFTNSTMLQSEQLDFVDMVVINDMNEFATNQIISPVEHFESEPERPGVLMTIGGMIEADEVNIRADEKMPPRGELSGQESLGGSSDITWNRVTYNEGSSGVSYDLLGRENWSDSSDVEVVPPLQSRIPVSYVENVSEPVVSYKCTSCEETFTSLEERKEHEDEQHGKKLEVVKSKTKKIIVKFKTEPPATVTTENFDNVFTNKIKVDSAPEVVVEDPAVKCEDLKTICSLCDVVVSNAKALREHKIRVHNITSQTRHKCATCDEQFPNDYKFSEHLRIHPLECKLCGRLFYRRQNIQLHMRRHLGIKPYKCDICEKAFLTKQKLDEHRNIHTGDAPIKCTLCDETFRRHSNLVQHRNRHHLNVKKKVKDYICFCKEVFHSKKKLAWHKEIHDAKPKACTQCSEKFIHMSSLTRHMRRAHNDRFLPTGHKNAENVECPICKGIYLKSSLEVHIRNHSGHRPYSCLICNKEFTTKWNLKLHKWTHASRVSKPFKCDQCKGAFVRESDYVAHMNSHKSVRPYTCNHCGAQFIRKYNCQRHVKEHENEKMFSCKECGKSFHRSYYLKDHMRIHSGMRPYSCHICGKTSTTKSNHNKHVQIHHAREPVSTEN